MVPWRQSPLIRHKPCGSYQTVHSRLCPAVPRPMSVGYLETEEKLQTWMIAQTENHHHCRVTRRAYEISLLRS